MQPSVFSYLFGQSTLSVESALNLDKELHISAARLNLHFAIKSSNSEEVLHVSIKDGSSKLSLASSSDELFTLSARSSDWTEFFAPKPKTPFQSYWGILRCLGHEKGVEILGDIVAFGRNARIWRLALDRIRNTIHGRQASVDGDSYGDDEEDDSIVGRYIWVDSPRWGRSKVFYESAGSGPQDILFLHTAGADSRQYHSLLNNRELQKICTMYAFDLPGHGRSYPGSKTLPEGYGNDEESYVAAIQQVIQKLKLNRTIVSGASMAGHICLAVALRAKELGVSGVIPCEACDYLPLTQPIYELPGDLNEAILNPERVCGMISPTAPSIYYRLIWWIYSSQGVKMFPGDLQFYFKGWDGRDRMHLIDTKACPTYMLTGEYDYSCTPEASRATAKKIPGAVFTEMEGLGHFPMSEDPKAFIPYLLKGIEHIQKGHSGQNGVNGGS
jgi:pimeloyl-ACP methyl ester carboxylesterase